LRPSVVPVSPDLLAGRLAEMITSCRPGHPVRVALDGAPSTGAAELAAALADLLAIAGRPPVVVDAAVFLRPASLRLERGRTDPDAYYEDWLDVSGLRRELLDPAGPGGSGQVVPSLRDPDTDRATRAPYLLLPDGAVVVVYGPLLLGRGLPFDLTVHLRQSAAALARLMPAELRWTLPAFARYDTTVEPAAIADAVVLLDDPHRPALLSR